MAPPKTIIFLGAPTAEEAMASWNASPPPPPPKTSTLRPFEIDPMQRTSGVTWRRLTDPVDSLSQELADTTMDTRSPEDLFLERSLQVYDNDDSFEEMDISFASEHSEVSISRISSPFLTGYDFDVNEITELEDLPSAQKISAQTSVSIIIAIRDIGQMQVVTTKYQKSINLVKLVVQDQTRQNFEIACWDSFAALTHSLRINDIVHFRDLGLSEFRGDVSAATRRKSRLTVLYRCNRLSRGDDVLRPRLDLEDQQTRFVRRLRDWVLRRSWVQRDVPPTLETQE